MGKPHPVALRARVVVCMEDRHAHRAAAALLRVSVKFVNDMVVLKRETGGLEPGLQGNGGEHGKSGAVCGAGSRRGGLPRPTSRWMTSCWKLPRCTR